MQHLILNYKKISSMSFIAKQKTLLNKNFLKSQTSRRKLVNFKVALIEPMSSQKLSA